MANLTTSIRWQRYEPDLPGNRIVKGETPAGHRPFYFELAADLSKEKFRALEGVLATVGQFPAPPEGETEEAAATRMAAEHVELCQRTAAALSPYVRFGAEPLTLDGVAVTTLVQYLEAVSGFQSQAYFIELSVALARVNSLEGMRMLFSERLSGGFASTASRRNG